MAGTITLYTRNILETGTVTVTGTADTGFPEARLHDRSIDLFWKDTADYTELLTDGGFDAVTETNSYTSDFSAGVDGWVGTNGTLAGNIDGIDGQDDNLRVTCSADNAAHYARQDDTAVAAGDCVRVRLDYYIPSGQSNVDGFWVAISGSPISGGPVYNTTDAWTSIDLYANAQLAGDMGIRLTDGGVGTFADAGADDVVYIRNVRIEAVTFTNWTAGTGWAPQATAGALTGRALKTPGTASSLQQNGIGAAGETYTVTGTVSGRTAGSVYFRPGTTGSSPRSADGTYTEDVTAVGNGNFYIYATNTFDGAVDTVSVQQLLLVHIDQGADDIYAADFLAIEKHNLDGADIEFQYSTDDSSWSDAVTDWAQSGNGQLIKTLGSDQTKQYWQLRILGVEDPKASEVFLSYGYQFNIRAEPPPEAVDVPNVRWQKTVGGLERSTKAGNKRRVRRYTLFLSSSDLTNFQTAVGLLDNYSKPFYLLDHAGDYIFCRFTQPPAEVYSNATYTHVSMEVLEVL